MEDQHPNHLFQHRHQMTPPLPTSEAAPTADTDNMKQSVIKNIFILLPNISPPLMNQEIFFFLVCILFLSFLIKSF